jgi:DNA-binding transcriptional regulator WhiA
MKTTQEQIDSMIRLYTIDKQNTYDIGNELNLSAVTVQSYLKKAGIQLSHQKYKFNEHYFNKIDTPNKAYFLGLIYADGCVFPKKNSCAIKLTKEDDYVLEEFKKDIDSQKPLHYTKSKPIVGTKYIGKAQCKLELNSKILIEDLISLGVVQNKSLILKFPKNMPFSKDFIRGYFDGDGCIYNSQNRIMLNFVGSKEFCKGLCDFLQSELNIPTTARQDKRGNSWYIYILRIKDVLKFCKYIYEDPNCVKLNRKYEKYRIYLG